MPWIKDSEAHCLSNQTGCSHPEEAKGPVHKTENERTQGDRSQCRNFSRPANDCRIRKPQQRRCRIRHYNRPNPARDRTVSGFMRLEQRVHFGLATT